MAPSLPCDEVGVRVKTSLLVRWFWWWVRGAADWGYWAVICDMAGC